MLITKEEFDFLTKMNKQAIKRHRKGKTKKAKGSVSVAVENLKQLKEADEQQFDIIIDTFEYSNNPSIQRYQCKLLIKLKQSISKNREEFKAGLRERIKVLEKDQFLEFKKTGESITTHGKLVGMSEELRRLLEGEGGEKKEVD